MLKQKVCGNRRKSNNKLKNIPLQSRLSVMPLSKKEFSEIIKLSNRNE